MKTLLLWLTLYCFTLHSDEFDNLITLANYYQELGKKELANKHLECAIDRMALYSECFSQLDSDIKAEITPHLIPLNHQIKPLLDKIFARTDVTKNIKSLQKAGFNILFIKKTSLVVIAKHILVPGYLFKIYLESEIRMKSNQPSWKWLVSRCAGAKKIQSIIDQNKILNFAVPEKFLYIVPKRDNELIHPVVLVVQDMNIVTYEHTEYAWRHLITPKHLAELYAILSQGYGSTYLIQNIPYTKEGKFAFIDTEYPYRSLDLTKIKRFISPDLFNYWDSLSTR